MLWPRSSGAIGQRAVLIWQYLLSNAEVVSSTLTWSMIFAFFFNAKVNLQLRQLPIKHLADPNFQTWKMDGFCRKKNKRLGEELQ